MVGIGRNHTMLEANPSVFQPCLSPTPVAHLGARQDLDAERHWRKGRGRSRRCESGPCGPPAAANEWGGRKCTASSFIARVELKTWPIGPVKRR